MSSRAERFAPLTRINTSGAKSIAFAPGITIDVRGLGITNQAQARQFFQTGVSPRDQQLQRETAQKSEDDFFSKIKKQFDAQAQALNTQLSQQKQPEIKSTENSPIILVSPQTDNVTMSDSDNKSQSTNIIPLVLLGGGALLLFG